MTKSSPRLRVPIVLLLGAGLLLITAACLLATQGLPAASPAPAPFAEDTYSEITRISLEDAKAAFDEGSAIFLDVRPASSYQESHVTGAINIPLDELEARLDELNKDDWIITYCT